MRSRSLDGHHTAPASHPDSYARPSSAQSTGPGNVPKSFAARPRMECSRVAVPGTQWTFCPNFGANVLFLVLFVLTTLVHLFQTIRYRPVYGYGWVAVFAGARQTLTYAMRMASIESPTNSGLYAAWYALILVAPLWTNAFAYAVFSRLIRSQTPGGVLWGLRGNLFGPVFVVFEVATFLVQVYGASRAAGNMGDVAVMLSGLHVYLIGLGVQLFFTLIVTAFALKLLSVMLASRRDNCPRGLLHLMGVQFVVLFLFVMRIVFRIVEYAPGLHSTLHREVFQYCLDALPMFLALALYNVVQPGRILGKRATSDPDAV